MEAEMTTKVERIARTESNNRTSQPMWRLITLRDGSWVEVDRCFTRREARHNQRALKGMS